MNARHRQRGGFALSAAGMSAEGAVSFRFPVLPWTVAAADERRFKGILTFCLAGALMGALALRVITLPAVDRSAAPVLPPPMARLILERAATPPARPEAVKAEAKSESTAAAKPAQEQPQPARRVAVVPPAARQPVEGAAPGELALEQARRKAASSGLLALKNELSALAAAPAAVQLQQQQETARPVPGVGTTSGPGAGAGSEAGEPARAMVTAAAGRNSGGIGNAGASRDSGGGGLAGRATTLLPGGGGMGAGAGGAGGANGSASRAGAPAANGAETVAGANGKPANAKAAGRATRSIEDIKLVFERQKAAIYALYNRALRDDPALQGKVVLELKIAPAGNVESVRIVSSELKSEELERKLLARIRSFDFGAKDVDALVLTWPVDFLPG